MKIETDHGRFKEIIRGKIKKELRKFITRGELIGRQGKEVVSIPLPQIEIPRFSYGARQMGGVGQGEGEPGTVIGVGEAEGGKPQAGSEPGEHILEVDVTLEELAGILGEELELPRITPKGDADLVAEKNRYTGVSTAGPESLRHFKRTYRQALKRQIIAGSYNYREPRVVPIREDRRYRVWRESKRPERNAAIIYMMDVSGCHTAGHFVEMADGTLRDVKDVREGDEVVSIDPTTHRKERGRVTKTFSFSTEELVEILTEDHLALQVTPQHRYFVYDEGEGCLKEKYASELSIGDSLVLVNQCGKGASLEDPETVLTEAQAYLLGAILGDGHVVDHEDPDDSRRNSRYVAITDEDENRLAFYADCAATGFGVRGIIRRTPEGRQRLHLNSVELVKWVRQHFPSICLRSRKRSVDPLLFRQLPAIRAAFIRGFFDAEGTLAQHAVEFLSSSHTLVKQFKLLLSYWGMRARLQKYFQQGRVIDGSRLKEGIFYRLILNAKDALIFRDTIGFQCRSKRGKLDQLCSRQRQGIDAMRSRYLSPVDLGELFQNLPSIEKIKSRLYEKGRRCFSRANLERMERGVASEGQKEVVRQVLENPLLTCRVKRVERRRVSAAPVYDFEVDPHHNYLIDGILSHNSMGAEQKEIVRIESFWIDTWLRSQYKGLEIRYIVHDAVAREVDRDTFYRTRESGGTIISSAYKLCLEMMKSRYLVSEWNVYPFHFSDGDNWSGNDTQECLRLLQDEILPRSNVFCYGQVESEYGSGQFLKDLSEKFPSHERVLTSKISCRDAIYDSIKQFLGKGR